MLLCSTSFGQGQTGFSFLQLNLCAGPTPALHIPECSVATRYLHLLPKLIHHSPRAWLLPTHFNETVRKASLHLLHLLTLFSPFHFALSFHLPSETNASDWVTFAWPLFLCLSFLRCFPVFPPLSHTFPFPSPGRPLSFEDWLLTGSAEQRNPGELNPLFLCLSPSASGYRWRAAHQQTLTSTRKHAICLT